MSRTRSITTQLPLISSDETTEKQRLRRIGAGQRRLGSLSRAFALSVALFSFGPAVPAFAGEQVLGPETKMPLPRFVSLKSDKVNMREGAKKENRTKMIYQRVGLPVEIIGEYENWRRIRDSDGVEGWVWQTLLSAKRTVLIAPWLKDKSTPVPLYDRSNTQSAVNAQLMPGVLARVKSCSADWCHIFGDGYDGYIEKTQVWGVYPDEIVE